MRTVVVHQPWAWAIVSGIKTVENRSWTTKHRGPLAILAGLSCQSLTVGTDVIESHGHIVPVRLPFGCLVGVVDLVDIIPVHESTDPFATGPWCWMLENPRALTAPVPCKGQLSLFEIPDHLITV